MNDDVLNSFSARNLSFEKFEREIHENFGIAYNDHPWLKPVRYSENRADKSKTILITRFLILTVKNFMKWEWDLFMQELLNPDISGLSATGNRSCTWKFSWDISTGELNNCFLTRKNLFSEPFWQNQLQEIV